MSTVKTIQLIQDCCSSLTQEPVDSEAAHQVARAFKALGDPVRVQILSLVASSTSGELCACDLPQELGISQPTVSHHLKLLTEAGILTRQQRGKWAFFRVDQAALSTLRALLEPTA